MRDWIPWNVLSNDVLRSQVTTRRSIGSLRFGLRIRSTPCNAVQSASTVAARTTLRAPPQGRHRVRNFHPLLVRFGRAATAPHALCTVTPVASIVTASSVADVTLPSPACAAGKRAAHVGAGLVFAAAGARHTTARSVSAMPARAPLRARMAPHSAHGGDSASRRGAAWYHGAAADCAGGAVVLRSRRPSWTRTVLSAPWPRTSGWPTVR